MNDPNVEQIGSTVGRCFSFDIVSLDVRRVIVIDIRLFRQPAVQNLNREA